MATYKQARVATPTESTDGIDPDGAEDGALVASRTAALQAWMDAQIPGGTVQSLPEGLYQLAASAAGAVALNSGRCLRGSGPTSTILRRASGTGAIVSTTDRAEWESEGGGKWTYEGGPMQPSVMDLGIHGGGTVNDQPWEFSTGLAYTTNGVDMRAPGARAQRLYLYQGNGTAVRMGVGNSLLAGTFEYGDTERQLIEDVVAHKWLRGIHIVSGADGVMRNVYLATMRDQPIKIDGAAWNVSCVHVAGHIGFDAEDDEVGVGIVVGKADGSSGENYLGELIQADNGRVGLRSNSNNNAILQFIGKLQWSETLDIVRRTVIAQGIIVTVGGLAGSESFNPNATGILIRNTASYCDIGGGGLIMEPASGATGVTMIKCLGSQNRIRASLLNGGLQAGARCITLGSTSYSPNGNVVDVTCYGAGVGLYIDGIGKGNEITIRHHGTTIGSGGVTAPVSVRGGVDPTGNRIVSINTATGVRTVHYDFS